jgi:hypothetical protein
MPLVNTLVIDHQLAAALLESLGQAKYEKLVGADLRRDLIAAGVALSGEGSDARSIAKTAAKTKGIR